MYIAGLVILIALGIYFLFLAVDGLGSQEQKDAETVVDREHRDAVMGNRIEIMNRQPFVTPHVTDEKYILKLNVDGRRAEGVVRRSLFEAGRPGSSDLSDAAPDRSDSGACSHPVDLTRVMVARWPRSKTQWT
jgi:hypothetical protein